MNPSHLQIKFGAIEKLLRCTHFPARIRERGTEDIGG